MTDNTFRIESPVSVQVTFICPATKQSVTVEAKDQLYIYDCGRSWHEDKEVLLDVSHCPSCGFSHEIVMD